MLYIIVDPETEFDEGVKAWSLVFFLANQRGYFLGGKKKVGGGFEKLQEDHYSCPSNQKRTFFLEKAKLLKSLNRP